MFPVVQMKNKNKTHTHRRLGNEGEGENPKGKPPGERGRERRKSERGKKEREREMRVQREVGWPTRTPVKRGGGKEGEEIMEIRGERERDGRRERWERRS